MSIRLDYLTAKFNRFLDRYSPPRTLTTEQAKTDELGALLRALDRVAPKDGYDGWWPRFEDALSGVMRTRAWPDPGEMATAAKMVPIPRQEGQAPDDMAEEIRRIALRKMVAGERRVVAHLVTVNRLLAIGLSHAEAEEFNRKVRASEAWHETYRSDASSLPVDEVRAALGMRERAA